MCGEVSQNSPCLQNMEPDKCYGWEWMSKESILDIFYTNPDDIFDPLRHFISENVDTFSNSDNDV